MSAHSSSLFTLAVRTAAPHTAQVLLLLLGCLLALAALAGVALRGQRRRRAALDALADERGWRRERVRAPHGLPLGRGARRARSGLVGEHAGRPVRAYEVVVSRATGAEPHVATWAVLEVGLPGPLPDLDLVPLDALGRAAARPLPAGVELESEDLARRYRVTSPDPYAASAVLGARTVAALLDAGPVRLRVRGDRALCWAPGPLDATGLAARLAVVTTLLDGVPRHVWAAA